MRITYLHQYFNTPSMSGGTRSYEMARRLVAKGHEVHMITSWRENSDWGDWFKTEEAGIKAHWLPVPYSNNMGFNQRIRAFVRFAWGAASKAASLPADVVFATSTPLTIALPGIYAARRKKVPMVFEVRDLWPDLPIAVGALKNPVFRWGARLLEQFAYKNSAHVVALSPGMRDGVVKTAYPAKQVSIIPNAADLDVFDTEKTDPKAFRVAYPEIKDGPLIVYTGTIGRVNGVDYLARIAAAALGKGLNLRFVVVGNGQQEDKVRHEAQRLGVLKDNFYMYPAVRKRVVPNILAAADVALSLFVDLKQLWANSANKFFDALASGTPIAINHGGWQADLLEDTSSGLILPPDDPREAARRLSNFVADPQRLKEAGKAARRLAEERFSRDKLADQLENVLISSVEEHDE